MTEDHRKRRPGGHVVQANQVEIERMGEVLGLPAALVGVAVAHIARRLETTPSEVLASFGAVIERLSDRAGRVVYPVAAAGVPLAASIVQKGAPAHGARKG